MNTSQILTAVCIVAAFALGSCATVPGENAPQPPAYAFEITPADEAGQIADISAKTMQLQDQRAQVFSAVQNGKNLRGVHPKSHGCVAGEFEVNGDIPPDLQVGLFATPGAAYPAIIRFSNAAVRLAHDLENRENASRGMAIKLLGVPGEVLVPDKQQNNQDFLMINTPVFAFANVRSYQRLTNALINSATGSDPSAAFQPTDDWTQADFDNLQKTLGVIAQIKSKTVRNPAEAQYFAAAPSTFGAGRVMKFSAEPCGGETIPVNFSASDVVSPDYLHAALASRMNTGGELCFDFKVQVLNADQVRANRSSDDTRGDLIEDATREWAEDEIPFTDVAKITVAVPQDIDPSNAGQRACERSAYNPWHSLTAHTPLGGINRLRRPVYISSEFNR